MRHSPQRLNEQKQECVGKPQECKSSNGCYEKVNMRVLAVALVSIEVPHNIRGVLSAPSGGRPGFEEGRC